MKLLTKTSLLIITASIFIFWLGNIVFFIVTREVIQKQINSDLMTQMSGVMTRINKGAADYEVINSFDEINITDALPEALHRPSFRDTVLYNASQQRYIAHRALNFSYESAEGAKDITLFKSLLSSDKLIERITLFSVILLISFILVILILNRYIFENVWSGFSESLVQTDTYNFSSSEKLILEKSEIEEFEQLNLMLEELTERIQHDYRNLKELTANTSHEIQTPLAIIKGKAELLLQSTNMDKENMEAINTILATVNRLAKLNQSLLLITKIENRQFEESSLVQLKDVLENSIENLEVLIGSGKYNLNYKLESCSLNINKNLLDILISNLLKNALIHSSKNSAVDIIIKNNKLAVSNPGEPLPFHEDKLFSRFTKNALNTSGNGIGLEIVKKICEFYEIDISYDYSEGLHFFIVDFSVISTHNNIL